MKIKDLELFLFKKFQINEIKKFSMEVKNRIQIIIGTNGSGKTSLLNELFPYVLNKNLFEKDGYKYLTIEMNNCIYKLGYRRVKNKKEHSFLKDEEELNTNKSYNLQLELIQKHLNITPLIKEILTCNINFAETLPSQRKQLFTNLNPIDTSIIEEKLKNTRAILNKIKNNLSMLYTRKASLQQEQLKPEEINQYIKQRKFLEHKETKLLVWITKISTIIEQLEKDIVEKVSFSEDDLKAYIKDIYINMHKYYSLDHKDIDYKIRNSNNTIITLKKENEDIVNKVTDINNKIDEKEKILLSKENINIQSLELKINTLLKEKKELEKNNFDNIFNRHEIKIYPDIKLKLITNINNLIDLITTPILNIETFNKLKDKKFYLDNIINSLKIKLNTLRNKKENIKNELKKLMDDFEEKELPSQCDKFNCYLYAYYSKNKQKFIDELKTVDNEIDKYMKKLKKYNKACMKISQIYNNNISYYPIIKNIKELLNKLPTSNFLISRQSLLEYANTYPMNIVKLLDNHFELSNKYYRNEKIKEMLIDLEKEYKSIKEKNAVSEALLKNDISLLKKEATRLEKKYSNNIKKINKSEDIINLYSKYSKTLNELNKINEKMEAVYNYTAITKSIEYYNIYIEIFQKELENVRADLSDIRTTIRNQESIQDRLNKEILEPIKDLEKNKDDYILIEKGLHKLSIEYIQSFINNIIMNTNFFINKIFTYPMVISTIDNIEDLDFKFKVIVNNVTVNDIKECSSGQKKVINLCFCLALIIELNLQHYPFFVDEVDKAMDKQHKQNLLELFDYLITENIISQLFAAIHITPETEGINGDIIVLNEDNILLPPIFNEHVEIKK